MGKESPWFQLWCQQKGFSVSNNKFCYNNLKNFVPVLGASKTLSLEQKWGQKFWLSLKEKHIKNSEEW